MAWLSGYNKRIKVTADHTKVDSDLSWFPLTIFLKSGDGDTTKIFDELGSNNLKMAITKSDGTTQLYVEIEQWDTTNKVGVLHCGRDGDTLSSSADTDYYIYYDSSHADNTDYVGVKNSTPAQSVWDSNFKAVYHMSDGADTSHIYDSTSNNNDGTKKAANEPIEADGKVAKAQYFDGSNDYVQCDKNGIPYGSSARTIRALIKYTSTGGIICAINTASGQKYIVEIWNYSGNWYLFTDGVNNNNNIIITGDEIPPNDSWAYIAFTLDGSNNWKYFLNGELKKSGTFPTAINTATPTSVTIGERLDGYSALFHGVIDETLISNNTLSAAWIKADYNSLNNSLLTYGAEETNANFFPFF